MEEDRRPSDRAAILALWVLVCTSAAVAAWRGLHVARVRPELQAEFVLLFIGTPVALVSLAALALVWLRQRRTRGRVLAAGLFGYAALRILLSFESGVEYPSELARLSGQSFVVCLVLAFSSLCAWLLYELWAFRRNPTR